MAVHYYQQAPNAQTEASRMTGANTHRRAQLFLQLRFVEQLNLGGIERWLQLFIKFGLRSRTNIVSDAVGFEVDREGAASEIVAHDPRQPIRPQHLHELRHR